MCFNKLICNYCFRNSNKCKVWRLQRQLQQSIHGADSNAETQIQQEEDSGKLTRRRDQHLFLEGTSFVAGHVAYQSAQNPHFSGNMSLRLLAISNLVVLGKRMHRNIISSMIQWLYTYWKSKGEQTKITPLPSLTLHTHKRQANRIFLISLSERKQKNLMSFFYAIEELIVASHGDKLRRHQGEQVTTCITVVKKSMVEGSASCLKVIQ